MVSLNPCSSALPRHALLLSHDQSVYEATKRNRVFQDSWLVSYSWFRYEKDDNVMLCGVWRFSQEHPALDSHGRFSRTCKVHERLQSQTLPPRDTYGQDSSKLTSQQQDKLVCLFNTANLKAFLSQLRDRLCKGNLIFTRITKIFDIWILYSVCVTIVIIMSEKYN